MSESWISILARLQEAGTPLVVVTVIDQQGSTPRDCGSKMVVTCDRQYGSIGGGNLEFRSIAMARDMLNSGSPHVHTERFPLGARLGQCCGGAATVLFEPVDIDLPHIALFGAGHVAQALITILAELPVRVSWVDSRREQFPVRDWQRVHKIFDEPLDALEELPADSYFIVMTHDHPLDFSLTERILKRGGYRYCGLIGSESKKRRFHYRLTQRGVSPESLARLNCPIGLREVVGKLPMEIAVAVAGEIISHYRSHSEAALAPSGGLSDLQDPLSA